MGPRWPPPGAEPQNRWNLGGKFPAHPQHFCGTISPPMLTQNQFPGKGEPPNRVIPQKGGAPKMENPKGTPRWPSNKTSPGNFLQHPGKMAGRPPKKEKPPISPSGAKLEFPDRKPLGGKNPREPWGNPRPKRPKTQNLGRGTARFLFSAGPNRLNLGGVENPLFAPQSLNLNPKTRAIPAKCPQISPGNSANCP